MRQVFDFLGFMWVPILTNFFNVIFCIFGYFGAHEYRYKYVLTVTILLMAITIKCQNRFFFAVLSVDCFMGGLELVCDLLLF